MALRRLTVGLRMSFLGWLWVPWLVAASPAAGQVAEACDDFHRVLQPYPHTSLTRGEGPFASPIDGSEVTGCWIVYETTSTLLDGDEGPVLQPDFESFRNPNRASIELYEAGWRFRAYLGSTAYGGVSEVERGAVRCFVESVYRWGRPGTDEEDRRTFTVRCGSSATPVTRVRLPPRSDRSTPWPRGAPPILLP